MGLQVVEDNKDGTYTIPVETSENVVARVVVGPRPSDDEVVVLSITVSTPEGKPVEGITPDDLRALSFSRLLQSARVLVQHEADMELSREYMAYIEGGPAPAQETDQPRTRQRRGSTFAPEELAYIAEHYLEAAKIDPRRPVIEMEKRLRKEGRDLSQGRIRERVKACRDFEWLTSVGQGSPGGVPGRRLIAWRYAVGRLAIQEEIQEMTKGDDNAQG